MFRINSITRASRNLIRLDRSRRQIPTPLKRTNSYIKELDNKQKQLIQDKKIYKQILDLDLDKIVNGYKRQISQECDQIKRLNGKIDISWIRTMDRLVSLIQNDIYILIMLIKNFNMNVEGIKDIDILLLKLRLKVRDILKNGVEGYQLYQDEMHKLFMKDIMILMKNTNDKINVDRDENENKLIDKIVKLFSELIQIITQITVRKIWVNKFSVLMDDLCGIDNKKLGYHNKQGINAKLRGIRKKYKIPMQLVGRIFCLKKYPIEKMTIITLVDINSMLVKLPNNTRTKVWIDQLYNVKWISMTSYLDTNKDILKRVINLENKSLRMIKADINADYRHQTGSSTMVKLHLKI